ncbi:hypothetical protein GGR55DRAFT_631952 [Xylaria sp. FL0064]|nr:hypothetical protein GGR55DRAFT_631952 [Xylaria sp. FL0064]
MTRKRACDVCYKRKIQCLIANPESPCEWCEEHDLACTFDRESQKKKRKRFRLSDVEGLFQRVEQLESALAETRTNHLAHHPGRPENERQASPSSDNEDDIAPSEGSPSPRIPFAVTESTESPLTLVPIEGQLTYLSFGQNPATGVPLSQYWYSRGIPLLSDRGRRYMHSKTDQDSTVERLREVKCPSHLQPITLAPRCSNQELWELPPKETVQSLASVFFDSPLQQIFPVLDHSLFEATIEEAYAPTKGTPSSWQAQATACIFAMLSVSNRTELSRISPSMAHCDAYAMKAQCIVMYMMTTEPSVVALQTVLMLRRYHMFIAQNDDAGVLHAMACRMVCELGGHTYQPAKHPAPELTWAERQGHHLRVLFWLCYMSDKDISLRSAHSPLLTEENCDLTIPECCAQLQGLHSTMTSNKFHFKVPGDPTLFQLKEKIHHRLFSPHAFKLSDGDLVSRIRQLDDDLERWRLSIPPETRPKLAIPPIQSALNQESHIAPGFRCAYLQLEYHHLVTAIHTTVRRCGANNPDHRDLPDDIHNVIHSSCDLSLEASRSTITFLNNSATVVAEQEFSDIVFYVTLAVISLFIDILAHPQNPESRAALNYLSSATDIIQSLFSPTSTQGELERIQETTRFIMELIELGNCAIEKAGRDMSATNHIPS